MHSYSITTGITVVLSCIHTGGFDASSATGAVRHVVPFLPQHAGWV